MKEQLLEIASKYDLQNIHEEILGLEESITVSVGFLGEFNTGKSTLINAIVGKKLLPAMDTPTTKSIIEIEPHDDNDRVQYYRKTSSGTLDDITALEFNDIATGNKEGPAVLFIPSNSVFKQGYRIVDTPGLASLDKIDADITFGYLPLLDGAVICIDINKGGMEKSVIDFISKSEVSSIAENLIFVITHIDEKSEQEVADAKCDVINKLKNLSEKGKVKISSFDSRVALISGEKILSGSPDYTLDDFLNAFDKHIVKKKKIMERERIHKELLQICTNIIALLEDRISNFTLDDTELRQKQDDIEKNITDIRKKKEKEEERLTEFRSRLTKIIERTSRNYVPRLQVATEDTVLAETRALVQDLTNVITKEVQKHVKDFVAPDLSHIQVELQAKIQNIIKAVDMAVTVTTAALTAYIMGGATLAAEAEEAAGAAVVREAGEASVKAVVKEAAKKATLKTTALKALAVVGKIIHDINPVEWLGDYAADKWKKVVSEKFMNDMAEDISYDIYSFVKSYYDENVFLPLEDNLSEMNRSVALALKERELSVEKRSKIKDEMIVCKEGLEELVNTTKTK